MASPRGRNSFIVAEVMYPAQILTRYNVAREDKLGKNTEVDENDKEDGSPEKNQYPPAQTNLADTLLQLGRTDAAMSRKG